MTTPHKVFLSFLVSFAACGIFAVVSFTSLFDLVETHFHNPAIIASINRDNTQNAEMIDGFFTEMENLFAETLKTEAVRQSFQADQNIEDIFDRAKIYTILIESLKWVQWVRFIDAGGVRIHFSSYEPDIQGQTGHILSYQNYDEPDFPYEMIAVKEGDAPKYTFDENSGRVLFSFPLYDSFDIYWGTALFSMSATAVWDMLVSKGSIRFDQNLAVVSNPPGLLFEMTSAGERPLPSQVAAIWREGGQKTTRFVSQASGASLALFSAQTAHGFYIGRLVNENIFSLSRTMKLILLASCFITLFLIVFLLFNLRQDPVTVVQNRIKKLQVSLIEQFYELRTETDWTRWIQELEYRREEITVQLKRGLKATSKDEDNNIDILIKKSWNELIAVLGGRREEDIEEERLKSILKRVLSELTGTTLDETARARFPNGSSSAAGLNALDNAAKQGLLMRAAAIVKEIEETDLVEELDETENLRLGRYQEEDDDEDADGYAEISKEDIEYLASKIEFNSDEKEEPEDAAIESIKEDLEIVSPFSSMLFDLSSSNKEASENNVIEEKDGVHYISGDVRNRGNETAALNKDFKNLVDSVIK